MRCTSHAASLTLLLLLSLSTVACGGADDQTGAPDVRSDADVTVGLPDTVDAGPSDTLEPDAKPLPDAVEPDSSPSDVGAPDSEVPDSEAPDGQTDDTEDDISDGGATDVDPVDTADTADVPSPECPETSELLAEAKRLLEAGQPRYALARFEEAEVACPTSVDARFGAALAGVVDSIETLFSLTSLAGQLGIAKNATVPEESQDEWLAGEVHHVFDRIADGFRAALARLDTLTDADVQFVVEQVPIYNATSPFLVYRGRFDQGDVHLMSATTRMLLFVLDVLRTQDYRTELLTLVWEVRDEGFDGVATVLYVLGRTLGGGPEFLSVEPVDGAEAFDEAKDALVRAADDLEAALEWMDTAGRPSDDEVSGLAPAGGGNVGTLILRAGVQVDEGGEVTYDDIRIELPEKVPAAFRKIADSALTPGQLVTWDEGPRWLVATLAAAVFKLGLVGELELGSIVISPDRASIQTLAALMAGMLPLPFAFDFGTFFEAPVGLRAFLPRPNDTQDGLVLEWECPGEVADDGWPDGPQDILCADADALVDGPHFVASVDEIAPDDLPTILPYLAFADPTMNGLLYIDLSAVGLADDPGYTLADQQSVNAGLAVGLEPILSLLAL